MGMIKMQFSGDNPSILSGRFWTKVLLMTLAIFITCYLFSVASVTNIWSALLAAIVISLLNSFIKPILVMFSMPLMVISLGMFNLVINAFIVLFADYILGSRFEVNGFFDAILFSIIITIIAFLLEIPEKIRQTKKKIEDAMNGGASGFNKREKSFDEYNEHVDDGGFADYEDLTDKEKEDKKDKE